MSKVSAIGLTTPVASVFHARRRRIDTNEILKSQTTQHLEQPSVCAPYIEDASPLGRNVAGKQRSGLIEAREIIRGSRPCLGSGGLLVNRTGGVELVIVSLRCGRVGKHHSA